MILRPQRALEMIAGGKLAPGYLLMGREVYWRDRVWHAIREKAGLQTSEAGVDELDLKQAPLGELLDRARERSLWSARQVLLVRNAQVLTPARGLSQLADYFADPSPFTTLVLEMTDVDLDEDDWREREKAKSRQEAWEEVCDVVCLASPSPAEAMELVRSEAAARGRRIAPDAAELLTALLGCDMGRMVAELEKLTLFEPDAKEISVAQVSMLVGNGGAARLPLTEAMASGQPRQVLDALGEVRRAGSYVPLVLGEVIRYARQLLLLQQQGARDFGQASRALWSARMPAPQSALAGMLRQAREIPTEHLVRSIRRALELEISLRSGPADEFLLLERYILDLLAPVVRRTEAFAGAR